MPILVLDKDDPEKEFEFELEYMLSLTFEQRFAMMEQRMKELNILLEEHGHQKPFEVLKRL
ncbi:hypothetical protein KJ564_13985 [bacterium]|nr:hypothetical protein [bacterium]